MTQPARSSRRTLLAACGLALAALALGGCPPAGGGTGGGTGGSAPAASAPQAVTTPACTQALAGSQAEAAELRRRLEGAAAAKPYRIVNGHEHLMSVDQLPGYLAAARKAGIVATVMVASPTFTLQGKGPKGEPGMERNFEQILVAAKRFPDEIIPFLAVDPDDPDHLARAQRLVAKGAKGVKLYSGHSNFYKKPLDAPDLDPLYAWLEQTGLPVCWHVNLLNYFDEFERVMQAHPYLNVQVPHYGVTFWRPTGPQVERLRQAMRRYPNLYLDTSLGTRKILIDGLTVMGMHSEVFQAFFREFPDRITWGTDGVVTGNREKTTQWWYKVIMACRDQLELPHFTFDMAAAYSTYHHPPMSPSGEVKGLALREDVLRKVYDENPRRWLAGPLVPRP